MRVQSSSRRRRAIWITWLEGETTGPAGAAPVSHAVRSGRQPPIGTVRHSLSMKGGSQVRTRYTSLVGRCSAAALPPPFELWGEHPSRLDQKTFPVSKERIRGVRGAGRGA